MENNVRKVYISSPWGVQDLQEEMECTNYMFKLVGIAIDSGYVPLPARLYAYSGCVENHFHILRENMIQSDEVWVLSHSPIYPIVMYDIFKADMHNRPIKVISPLAVDNVEQYNEWSDLFSTDDGVRAEFREVLQCVEFNLAIASMFPPGFYFLYTFIRYPALGKNETSRPRHELFATTSNNL